MDDLLSSYQRYCTYPVNDYIQKLDFSVDIEVLRKEIFNFITNNNYGFNLVSLRLPEGETNYLNLDEDLKYNSVDAFLYLGKDGQFQQKNVISNKEYTVWHPDLKDSYVASLVPELEKFTKFKIGRIRLAWLQPNSGYPMHFDFEPLRFHIPLITNQAAYFFHSHKLYHMEYGKLQHIITSGLHTAWNFGNLPRLHLTFSTYGDDAFTKELDQLGDLTNLRKSFVDHVYGDGIDETSLSCLLKIQKSSADNKSIDQLLYETRVITELLTKNH